MKHRIQNAFNRAASTYGQVARVQKKIAEHAASLVPQKEYGKILELGCGNGNFTQSLVNQSNTILATDISKGMLAVAEQRLSAFDNVSVGQADCYNTGLEAGAYDTVFMANLIHVVAEPDKLIKEVRRLLKADGRLIIASATTDSMSFIAKVRLIYRYLKAFGKPPKGGTKFTLQALKNFIVQYSFRLEEAKLLGSKQSKALFLIARKREK